jgi:hypothetical protein
VSQSQVFERAFVHREYGHDIILLCSCVSLVSLPVSGPYYDAFSLSTITPIMGSGIVAGGTCTQACCEWCRWSTVRSCRWPIVGMRVTCIRTFPWTLFACGIPLCHHCIRSISPAFHAHYGGQTRASGPNLQFEPPGSHPVRPPMNP